MPGNDGKWQGWRPYSQAQYTARSVGPHPELAELTASDLSRLLAAGELTSAELVQMSLGRIAALDLEMTHSVIELNPDAAEIARRLDGERRRGRGRGPLHGLPVLVKDNIDTGDGMLTTAGSLAMTGAPALRDAPLVARLRRAGAVVIGKTNLSEWANIRSIRSSSGWSGRGAQGLRRHPGRGRARRLQGASGGRRRAHDPALRAQRRPQSLPPWTARPGRQEPRRRHPLEPETRGGGDAVLPAGAFRRVREDARLDD